MPAKSEKQRKFMGAELARKRAGQATKTDMTEEELEDFASKEIKKEIASLYGLTDTNKPSSFMSKVPSDDVKKILIGARSEGTKPQLPDHLLPRKRGKDSTYPPDRGGSLGPYRELKKQQEFLKFEVAYQPASPIQLQQGEKCDTCMYWKDGGACHLVVGFIHGDMWCNKWEQSTLLQGEHPIAHLQQSPSVQRLQKIFQKEDGGSDGGGALAGGGTVFTSTNAGIFTPTHGGNGKDKKEKKKKTGIERLGQFLTDNSPEKKMVKSSVFNLTNLINEVRLELRKDDEKRQTPFNSKPTPDDPPQVVERGKQDKNKKSLPEDPNLVYQQNMTTKEQKRIMNEDKNKDGSDPHTLLMAWGSGGVDVDELHRGGKKDELEFDEDRNKPEKKKLPFSKRFEKELEVHS